MLGKASLQVSCAHLASFFVGLGFYMERSAASRVYAVGLVALTFVGLIFVVLRKIRRERLDRQPIVPELKINPPPTYALGLTGD